MNSRQIYEGLLQSVEVPGFVRLECTRVQPCVPDVGERAYQEVAGCESLSKIKPGDTVAITAGSREVFGITEILRGVIRALKEKGALPFIVPAMGSHGGATAEGQLKVLEHFGITEESVNVPIRSSMETVEIGKTADGHPVHIDRISSEANFILPIGRIKAHTDFHGRVESGIMKMLAIGLGKQYGASLCHKLGFPRMAESVWSFGQVILMNARILLGVGIVENAEHRTATIEAILSERIPKRESELLAYSKSLLPKIPFDGLDVLLVGEMGKDISGAGMDPNVTGRSCTTGEYWPHAEKIGVFDITAVSDGNAAGIGNADAITRRLFNQIDTTPMYINSLTCRDTLGVRIPTIMDTEDLVVKYLVYTCIRRDAVSSARIVWIKNTANLRVMYISEELLQDTCAFEEYKTTSGVIRPVLADDGRLYIRDQWI